MVTAKRKKSTAKKSSATISSAAHKALQTKLRDAVKKLAQQKKEANAKNRELEDRLAYLESRILGDNK